MSKIYFAITGQFDFLKGYGLVFDYVESKGKLGDRYLKKFSYCNINLGKKFEIVYCTTDLYSRLHGYLVKSDLENKNQLDPQNIIPFDRLRYFFEEGGEVIFFGNEQFDFLYKLKELKLVAERFLTCVISNSWINYAELLSNEKRIYVSTLEPKNYFTWADEIKANDFIKNYFILIYDASNEPSYEAYGLILKSKNEIEFHITYGYKTRDEVGFSIQVKHADNKTETRELMNVWTSELVEFLKKMIKV